MLHQDLICEEPVLADNINRAFVNIMKDYQPLTDSVRVSVEDDEPITVTEKLVENERNYAKLAPHEQVVLMSYLTGYSRNTQKSW